MAVPAHPETSLRHTVTYPRFLWRLLALATRGGWPFYGWMTVLTCVSLVGVYAWAAQIESGMAVTGMSDHVSWGLYIANFTFAVGLAAGGVMMVIPAYLYHDEDMHDVVIVGELLAIAALVMALLFVVVDLGRPDRFWHLIPGIGRFNWPISMLTWDVVVLNGYLALNLHITGYLLYQRFLRREPNPRFYIPFVLVSIVWAISVHTVTAFLYSGLGGRPFWNSALLAPRFLASAFVTGPAFIILTLEILKRVTRFPVPEGAAKTLLSILKVTAVVNLFMALAELFTALYTGGAHASAATYLFFGAHGRTGLVPWTWTAMTCNTLATLLLLSPFSRHPKLLWPALVMLFVGVWIEKGMGLIVPGFIPSTLHEVVEYSPSLTEWQVTAGVWAFGLLVFTAALKVALPVISLRAETDTAHGKERLP